MWLATGNNLRTGGDMASRTVWVRLDPNCPRPEARTGFTIPNLDTWILDPVNRATVLAPRADAGARLDRQRRAAGQSVPQMRQFTRWAQYLGGFLTHHDVGGFLGNADAGRGLDEDAAEWYAFLATWHDLYGGEPVTAQQLRSDAEPEYGAPDRWKGTFPTTAAGKPLTPKSLGKRLAGQKDRWRGDLVLRSEVDPHTKMKLYTVERGTDSS